MQFIFKELAAEFPKKQCDYIMDDFFQVGQLLAAWAARGAATQSANAAVVWEGNCLASKRGARDDSVYALDAGTEVVFSCPPCRFRRIRPFRIFVQRYYNQQSE